MPIDVSRYPLITQEFRYAVVLLPTVATAYAKARELEIDTKFRYTSDALAAAISAVVGVPKRRLEITVSDTDTIAPSMFESYTPTVTLIIPALNVNGLYVITRVSINEDEDQTTFEAWGG